MEVLEDMYRPIDDDIALPWTLQHLMASVELILNIDKPPGSAADWWQLYQEATEEVQHGASMRMGMVSILGQKPRESEMSLELHMVKGEEWEKHGGGES